jgi:glycosyltransferase involved in cell wall biosynthesis
MRIAVDIRPLMERRPGGVALFTADMVRALQARGAHDYALFCNSFGEGQKSRKAERQVVGAHISRFPNKLLNASFAFLDAPTIESLVGGADAVYLPNLNFAATRKPYVVTVHDLSFERYARFFSKKQRLWHAMVRPKRLILGAAKVAAVSRHTKEDLVETYDVPAAKVEVVHPGVGGSYRPQPPATVRAVMKRYALERPYFLFLGTIEPRKNIKNVIAAFDRLSGDENLVVAGGTGWLYRETLERAARSPRRERIRFIGYVPEEDKPALYAGSIALVYPSYYEGFGLPPLEAMACGTPVVASHATSLGEVVGDAGLLVDPYRAREIAEAMMTVRDEPAFADELRRRGLERARRFTWNESAKKMEAIFEKITGGPA